MTTSPEMVTIGKIDRPFGVHGAVKVRSLSDRPGRFEQLGAVRVAGQGGQSVDRTVRHVRRAGSSYILEFEGVTTPEEAGMLRGALLQVPRMVTSAPELNAWYECDLIGMMGRVGERRPASLKPASVNIDIEPTNISLACFFVPSVSLG